jgi:serine protease Do
MPRPVSELVTDVAPALVKLQLSTGQAVGFLFSGFGHLAASLHAVAGATWIKAELADGRTIDITEVVGLDATRDLLVLHLEGERLPYVHLRPEPLPEPDARAVVVMPSPVGPAPNDTRIAAVRCLNPELSVLELQRAIEEGASGAPICDEDGHVVAVATAARASDDRPVGLGIPARYLVPFLSRTERIPLERLAKGGRKRRVPDHPISLLDGSRTQSLQQIASEIVEAISVGAPTYNGGDPEGCYRIYARVARKLCDQRCDCPGATVALQEGLGAAAHAQDPDDQAWILRDTFDGLLDVIERWLKQNAPQAALKAGKKSYLN